VEPSEVIAARRVAHVAGLLEAPSCLGIAAIRALLMLVMEHAQIVARPGAPAGARATKQARRVRGVLFDVSAHRVARTFTRQVVWCLLLAGLREGTVFGALAVRQQGFALRKRLTAFPHRYAPVLRIGVLVREEDQSQLQQDTDGEKWLACGRPDMSRDSAKSSTPMGWRSRSLHAHRPFVAKERMSRAILGRRSQSDENVLVES